MKWKEINKPWWWLVKDPPDLLSSITAALPQHCLVPPGWESGTTLGVKSSQWILHCGQGCGQWRQGWSSFSKVKFLLLCAEKGTEGQNPREFLVMPEPGHKKGFKERSPGKRIRGGAGEPGSFPVPVLCGIHIIL